MMVQIAAAVKVDVQYFFDELPTGVKNTKEIKTPALVEMSLAAHGPRLIDEAALAIVGLLWAMSRASMLARMLL